MTQLYLNTSFDYLTLNASGDWLLLDALSSNSYPSSPAPIEATVSSFAPTYASVTHGLQRQVRSRGAHAWRIDLRYGGMTRAGFSPLWAFLVKQGGQLGTFDFALPGLTLRGAGGGTPRVNGGTQTGTSLITDGWPNSTAVLLPGDFIQIENYTKVYQVTDTVTSDGSGNATIPIYPALRTSPTDNLGIVTSVLFRCALGSDSLDVDWSQCLYALGFTITLVEVQQ